MKDKVIGFAIPDELLREIDEYRRRIGPMARGAVVRLLLREALETKREPQAESAAQR